MLTALLTLIGGGAGGFLRFIPEILKLFTDNQDRAHEYQMTQLQMQIDAQKAQNQIAFSQAQAAAAQATAQVQAQTQVALADAQSQIEQATGQMQAYMEAIKGQAQLTGNKIVDALNALVRPILTYWWMALYTAYKVLSLTVAWEKSPTLAEFVERMWTAQDWGILSMIIGFWFVDRAIRKNNGT